MKIKGENTLALFLGAITGAMNAGQLDREYGQYVNNMEKISELAQLCYDSLEDGDPSRKYFFGLLRLKELFYESIRHVPVSQHVEVIRKLADYYNAANGFPVNSKNVPFVDINNPRIVENSIKLL